jgi:hypothetical protein
MFCLLFYGRKLEIVLTVLEDSCFDTPYEKKNCKIKMEGQVMRRISLIAA